MERAGTRNSGTKRVVLRRRMGGQTERIVVAIFASLGD